MRNIDVFTVHQHAVSSTEPVAMPSGSGSSSICDTKPAAGQKRMKVNVEYGYVVANFVRIGIN